MVGTIQAFEVDPAFSFPTPRGMDDRILMTRHAVIGSKPWKYGEPYYDRKAYPDHVLVFVEPTREHNVQNRWYASKRLLEDQYNFEVTRADIDGVKFDMVARTYFFLRDEWKAEEPIMGEPLVLEPKTAEFAADYVLANRQQVKAQDPRLNSLFVTERRVYVKRCTIFSVEHEDMLGIGQGRAVDLYFMGEKPPSSGDTNIEVLIASPSNAYWGVQADGTVRTGQQISNSWFAVTTFSSLDDALAAFKLSFPSSVDIDIPDELLGVAVVWNSAGSNGTFTSDASGRSAYVGDPEVSLSLSESANAECGGSVQPEIIPNIRKRKGRDIPSTAWFFYIKSSSTTLSAADVLAKLTALAGATVSQWPLFQPAEHTFTLKGQRGSGRAQVSAFGSVGTQFSTGQERNNKEVSSAKGVSYDFSTSWGTVVLPPTIHGAITVSNTTPPTSSYTAVCTVGWVSNYTAAIVAGYSIALPVPDNSGPGNLDPTTGGMGTVSDTATVALSGAVAPTSLAATTPASIPTSGLYMVGSPQIKPYKARWFQCSAQVLNATILAP